MTNFILFFLLFQTNIDPKISTLIEGAKIDVDNRQFQYAQKKLDQALEIDPNNQYVYYWKGYTYMNEGDLDLAIGNFTESIKIDDKFTEAFNVRGLCYGYKDQGDLALADFDRAILLDPNFVEAYINRGSALIGKGEYEIAKSDLNEALKIDPDNGSAFFHLGRVYQSQGLHQKARKEFQRAINNEFVNIESLYEFGNSLFQTSDFKNAVEAYSLALEFNPDDHKTLNNRALAYDSLGKSSLAEKDRQKLRDISGINFKPLDQLEYKVFSNSDSQLSISLPNHWNKFTYDSKLVDEEYFEISPQQEDKRYSMSGLVKIRITKNMFKNFEVKGEDALLAFWLETNTKQTDSYEEYDVALRKTKKINNYNTNIFQTKSVINKGDTPVITKEVIITKQDEIISIFMESPLPQYKYFEPIFDKALNSIVVK